MTKFERFFHFVVAWSTFRNVLCAADVVAAIDSNEIVPAYSNFDWCKDNEERFDTATLQGDLMSRKCAWISAIAFKRCKFENAASNCPRTCDYCNCVDNQEKLVTCNWVKRKPVSRCKILDAYDNCPLTCGRCATTSPSSAPSIASTVCKDIDTKFEIDSLAWVNGKKSCMWAKKKLLKRCSIMEVQQNCPILCESCPTTSPSSAPSIASTVCKDIDTKFEIDSLAWVNGKKSCMWAKKKLLKRCSIMEVQQNCPVACGECIPPSYPTLEANVIITIEVIGTITIPTDPTEYAELLGIFETAYEPFIPKDSTIILVQLSSHTSSETTTTTVNYTVQKIFQCYTWTCEDMNQDVADYKQECEDLLELALLNNTLAADKENIGATATYIRTKPTKKRNIFKSKQ